jgi:hypothetical protein
MSDVPPPSPPTWRFPNGSKVFGEENSPPLDRLAHHAHILATRGDSYRSNKHKVETDNRAPLNDNSPR